MMGFFTVRSLSVIIFTPFLFENFEYVTACSYVYISLTLLYKEINKTSNKYKFI